MTIEIVLIMVGAFILIAALSFVILFLIMFIGELGKILPFKEGKYKEGYGTINAVNGSIVKHKGHHEYKVYAPEITYYNEYMKSEITKVMSNASIPDPKIVNKENERRKKKGLPLLYVPKAGDRIKIQYTSMKVRVYDDRITNENTYSIKPHLIRIGCFSIVSLIGLGMVLMGIFVY